MDQKIISANPQEPKKAQYDGIAKEYAASRNATQKYVTEPTLLAMTGSLEGKDILDIGCGNGYQTRKFAAHHPKSLVGMDASPEMIALAKQNLDPANADIDYRVTDLLAMDYEERFDVIVGVYIINYAKTYEELVTMCKNIYKHLRSDGRFATITFSPRATPRNEFIRDWRFIHPEGKEKWLNGEEVLCEKQNPVDGKIISFTCYYWDEGIYKKALLEAGFSAVEWVYDFSILEEGVKELDEEYWEQWKETTVEAGLVAQK